MPTPVQVNGSTGVLATALQVRGGACNVTAYQINNPSTGAGYVQLFDTMIGPTVGTTQATWTIFVPTGGQANLAFSVPGGLFFSQGLWVAATTGAQTGAPGSALQVNLAMS